MTHLQKTGTGLLVRFSVPVSGACVIGIINGYVFYRNKIKYAYDTILYVAYY